MARGHIKGKVAGATGHDGGSEDSHEFRGRRNAGGQLHRRGQKRKQETSPIVAEAVVAHIEQQDAALQERVRVAIEHANTRGRAARAAETDKQLWILSNMRYLPPVEEKEAYVAGLFAKYGK